MGQLYDIMAGKQVYADNQGFILYNEKGIRIREVLIDQITEIEQYGESVYIDLDDGGTIALDFYEPSDALGFTKYVSPVENNPNRIALSNGYFCDIDINNNTYRIWDSKSQDNSSLILCPSSMELQTLTAVELLNFFVTSYIYGKNHGSNELADKIREILVNR